MNDSWQLKSKEAILHKVVFELRYNFGMTYLDRCGKTVSSIMKNYPEWTMGADDPSPQNAPLISLANAARFNFGSKKLDLSIERKIGEDPIDQTAIEKFIDQSDSLTTEVVEQLGLSDFSRIGTRVWYLFRCESPAEAEDWLRSLGIFTVSSSVSDAFGGTIESVQTSIVISGEDFKYRVAATAAERQAQIEVGSDLLTIRVRDLPEKQRETLIAQQKLAATLHRSPQYVAMIDVDVSLDTPPDVNVRSFMTDGLTAARERLRKSTEGSK